MRYDTHLLEASNHGEQSKVTDTPLEGKGRDVDSGRSGDRVEEEEEEEERKEEKNGGREGHRPWIPHYYHLLHSEHSICSTAGLHTHTHKHTQVIGTCLKLWLPW